MGGQPQVCSDGGRADTGLPVPTCSASYSVCPLLFLSSTFSTVTCMEEALASHEEQALPARLG